MDKILTAQSLENISKEGLMKETKAANYLNLSRSFIKQLRARGGGPLFIKCGRAVRYRLEDLDKWIERNVRRNTIQVTDGRVKNARKGGRK